MIFIVKRICDRIQIAYKCIAGQPNNHNKLRTFLLLNVESKAF